MKLNPSLIASAAVVLAAGTLAAATGAKSKAAVYDPPPEYYQCMDGCTIGWLEHDERCGRIGTRYGVSSYEYEICASERERELDACALNCDRTYPPRDGY